MLDSPCNSTRWTIQSVTRYYLNNYYRAICSSNIQWPMWLCISEVILFFVFWTLKYLSNNRFLFPTGFEKIYGNILCRPVCRQDSQKYIIGTIKRLVRNEAPTQETRGVKNRGREKYERASKPS